MARFLRMPAVSMMTKDSSPSEKRVSMASRVVPAMSETITRSSPRMRLTSELLPTLGLPTTAIWMGLSSSSSAPSSGKSLHNSSRRSPKFMRLTEEMPIGSPMPSW